MQWNKLWVRKSSDFLFRMSIVYEMMKIWLLIEYFEYFKSFSLKWWLFPWNPWTSSSLLFCINSKIQKYSPSESAKVYDKTINRKTGVHFHPKQTLDFLRSDMANSKITEEVKRSIVKQYLDVSKTAAEYLKLF